MEKKNYYIFIDLLSSNSCLWDKKDNLEEFGDENSNQIYFGDNKAKVGRDSVEALNMIIDHAKNHLGLEPIVLLAVPKGARNRMPGVMIKYLKERGLHDCEIQDWNYQKTANGGFAREISLKMYHDEQEKKEGFFDRFHESYAKKSTNFCVVTRDAECYYRPVFFGFSYCEFINSTNMIIPKNREALDPSQARDFVIISLAQNGISPAVFTMAPIGKKEQEIEILNAEALSKLSNPEKETIVDEQVEIAETLAEEVEPERE